MIYLDHGATTPLSQSMVDYLSAILNIYGNPNSVHSIGLEAKKIVEDTRKKVAEFTGSDTDEVIFTSGGSAALSLGIRGYLDGRNCSIYYSPLLHKSALKCIEANAFLPEKLKVDKYGFIDLEDFESRINPLKYKPFVIVEWASSEIGTIQNIKEIIGITHRHGGIVLVDATACTSSLDLRELVNADMFCFAGHKIGSLKGIGVCIVRNVELVPLVYGTQEKGLFAGTTNTLGVASLGKAIDELDLSSISSHDRDCVWDYIEKNISDAYVVGAPIGENRLKHNLYVCFPGCEGESLQMLLDNMGICVSTGSACSSGSLEPSATLTAIGMDEMDAHSCIRLTFGHERLSKEELDYVCESIKSAVEVLREWTN